MVIVLVVFFNRRIRFVHGGRQMQQINQQQSIPATLSANGQANLRQDLPALIRGLTTDEACIFVVIGNDGLPGTVVVAVVVVVVLVVVVAEAAAALLVIFC